MFMQLTVVAVDRYVENVLYTKMERSKDFGWQGKESDVEISRFLWSPFGKFAAGCDDSMPGSAWLALGAHDLRVHRYLFVAFAMLVLVLCLPISVAITI